jgi:uracil-DNA glycosylase family 4
MPELPREELRRLAVGLKEFVQYQRRLGMQLLEGTLPLHRPQPALPQSTPEPEKGLTLTEMKRLTLEEIRTEMGDCRRCQLWKSRTRLVFGAGDPKARLMFIGEAPGAEEDQQGEPFVGESGELFNRILAKMEISRSEVYITNAVKSRPLQNRTPAAEEIAACRPFLLKQILAIRPQIIVTLGAVATQALLASKTPISRLRGKWHKWQGIAVMPTFHPSYLLRVRQEGKKTWEDMQQVLAIYRGQGISKAPGQ